MKRVKYPRTYHMPWSPGVQSDDKVIKTTDRFIGQRVILTEKMDGENTTLYRDGLHARSLDSAHHPSRDFVKSIWSQISYMIPENERVCGENLYARHSVAYDNLEGYFYVFSNWEGDVCKEWDYTVTEGNFGLPVVKVLYDGIYDERTIRDICENLNTDRTEGAVLRIADEFHYNEFNECVMKFVRKGHVQTDQHWMNRAIVPNGIKVS